MRSPHERPSNKRANANSGTPHRARKAKTKTPEKSKPKKKRKSQTDFLNAQNTGSPSIKPRTGRNQVIPGQNEEAYPNA